VELFPEYAEELKERSGGKLPHINSFEVLVYLYERKGLFEDALALIKRIKELGIPYPQEEEVLKRISDKINSL
jgi:pentatricopeptide repeat protein